MCLIIASLKGTEINKDHLERGYVGNPHGSGLMYSKDNKLFVKKGFFNFDEFYNYYKINCIGVPHVIHHRWKTSGEQNEENCHPFIIRTDKDNPDNPLLAFVHNGSISEFDTIPGKSDTFNFNESFLKVLDNQSNNPNWWKNKDLKLLISGALKSTNRVVMMDNAGFIEIYNSVSGEWIEKDNIWASNDHWKVSKSRPGVDWSKSHLNTNKSVGFYSNTNNNTGYLPPQGVSESCVLKPKINNKDKEYTYPISTIESDKFKDIGPEELEEIDSYLDELNDVTTK